MGKCQKAIEVPEKCQKRYMAKKKFGKILNGYEGIYQVSNLGRIKSLDRRVKDNRRERYQNLKGKQLKFTDNGRGYQLVFLTKESKRINKYVHRLVAETFIPNPKNLPEVNHKDLNKSNNCIDNLEWITNADNKRHYQKTDVAKVKRKEQGYRIQEKYKEKIKNKIPFIIYAYTKLNYTLEKLNKETGIGDERISKILKENNIPINNKPRKRLAYKRDKLGRFAKGGILCEQVKE